MSIYSILVEKGVPTLRAEKFADFAKMLREENSMYNLTSITDDEQIAKLHFLDSMAVSPFVGYETTMIDVGTGAGFPSVPLSIMRGDIAITAVDATEKKIKFVEKAVREFGLNITPVCARAEELSREPGYRDCFDSCVSRAVAALPVLMELCVPFVKKGGKFFAYKAGEDEIAPAAAAAAALNAKLNTVHGSLVSGTDHCIIEYIKTAETPAKYPRRYAQIKSRPL